MPPARRAPTAPAPVLRVQPETLHVGEPTPTRTEPVGTTSARAGTPEQVPSDLGAPVASQSDQPRVNIAKTLRFYADTERRMVTVAARGSVTPGMPSTITEFVNEAFDLYLQKLADEFNGGDPFPMAPHGTKGVTGPRPR